MSLDNFVFPHDVEGWLSEKEGRALAELAQGKTVLELGTFKGRSTICMAQTANIVWTIDTHYHGSLLDFMANIAKYGMSEKVIPLIGRFEKNVPFLKPIFDLILIDGEHVEEEVWHDSIMAGKALKLGGTVAWHDYGHPKWPAVQPVVDKILACWQDSHQGTFHVIDTLAILQTAKV